MLLCVGLVAAGVAVVWLTPQSFEARALQTLAGAVALVGLAVLYLAFRTLRFARHVAADNVAIRARLTEFGESILRGDRQRNADHGQILGEVRDFVSRFERRLTAFENGAGDGRRLSDVLRELREGLASTQASLGRIAAREDAQDAMLSSVSASIDRLTAAPPPATADAIEALRKCDRQTRERADGFAQQMEAIAREVAVWAENPTGRHCSAAAADLDSGRNSGERSDA
jgi:hypothetical protein